MTSAFLLFLMFSASVTTGVYALPVTDSSDFLVVPVSSLHRIEVVCNADSPKTVRHWKEQKNAKMAFNAGFFDSNAVPVGFAKTAKNSWGSPKSHPAYFGVFPDGTSAIVPDDQIPSQNAEYAASGFPLLIWEKKNRFLTETKKYDRRTIVAQKNGKLFFFVSVRGYPSLAESAWALERFEVDSALNLDGGTSTGFFIGSS
jgi:uncharacterized protein YigE (DUF2233 family)